MGGPFASRALGTPSPPGYLWSETGWESEKLCYLLDFPPEIGLPQSPLVQPPSHPPVPWEVRGLPGSTEATVGGQK